ncbi:MAG: tetratricopeptide repeat protein [Deltaproteobacteria bacterium]|nr:tetratricopeptide repeat protein [Deltaproteobacteria bacterium]
MKAMELTNETLADRCDVTPKTVDDWRHGRHLPKKHGALLRLAEALATPTEVEAMTWELRLRIGISALKVRLVKLLEPGRHRRMTGETRLADLMAGIACTAKGTRDLLARDHEALRTAQPPNGMLAIEDLILWRHDVEESLARLAAAIPRILRWGSFDDPGRSMCQRLAQSAPLRPEVGFDFLALATGAWVPRIQRGYELLGRPALAEREGIDLFPTEEGLTGRTLETYRVIAQVFKDNPFIKVDADLRLADFDEQPPEGAVFATVPLPSAARAELAIESARSREAAGDLLGAIHWATRSLEHDPTSAYAHFLLGALVGQLATLGARARIGDPLDPRESSLALPAAPDLGGLLNASILALRQAVRLDPDFGNARNEIGVVLSNVGLHDAAEVAFQEAEPHDGTQAHHWLCRGCNYIALERYEDAARALERAIASNRQEEHDRARVALAAVLVRLGRRDRARNIGKPIEGRTGSNPADSADAIISAWQRFRRAGVVG